MKAPEKIYLNPIQDALTEMLSTKVKGDIEYTRTDAFIEKACAFIRERLNFDDNAWYIEGEVTIKDKVIEDFKNYIKSF